MGYTLYIFLEPSSIVVPAVVEASAAEAHVLQEVRYGHIVHVTAHTPPPVPPAWWPVVPDPPLPGILLSLLVPTPSSLLTLPA